MEIIYNKFHNFDTDGDAVLTREEFLAFKERDVSTPKAGSTRTNRAYTPVFQSAQVVPPAPGGE